MGKKHLSIAEFRKSMNVNQSTFWGLIGVTQSGGSRYENGRTIPKPVLMLLKSHYNWTQK